LRTRESIYKRHDQSKDRQRNGLYSPREDDAKFLPQNAGISALRQQEVLRAKLMTANPTLTIKRPGKYYQNVQNITRSSTEDQEANPSFEGHQREPISITIARPDGAQKDYAAFTHGIRDRSQERNHGNHT